MKSEALTDVSSFRLSLVLGRGDNESWAWVVWIGSFYVSCYKLGLEIFYESGVARIGPRLSVDLGVIGGQHIENYSWTNQNVKQSTRRKCNPATFSANQPTKSQATPTLEVLIFLKVKAFVRATRPRQPVAG